MANHWMGGMGPTPMITQSKMTDHSFGAQSSCNQAISGHSMGGHGAITIALKDRIFFAYSLS